MFVVGKSTEDRVEPLDTIYLQHCTDSNCQNFRERLTSLTIIRMPVNRKISIGKCILKNINNIRLRHTKFPLNNSITYYYIPNVYTR